MLRDPINKTRYRTLQVALCLVGASSLGAALMVLELPQAHPVEWLTFLVAGVLSFGLLAVSRRYGARGDRRALERLAQAALLVGAALIIQRMAWSLYGTLIDQTDRSLFRPGFAFMPFLYLGALMVMRSKAGVRFCWGFWIAVLALSLPALYVHTGFSLARDGMVAVLVWLLLANPLFILMMQALPHYEEQLVKTNAEMRENAELLQKLTESEQRFNLVVDSLEVGVWDRWTGPPERRWWSPRFYELIGYPPDELSASDDHLKSLLHPDDRERVWEEGDAQLQRTDIMDVDFRLRTGHRGYRWFNSHAKAQRDAQGRMVRLAGSITDIHDRRMAQEMLQTAQTELTRLAYRDTLTDLHNRRYFEEHFQREWERSRRNRQPLALVLIDLDHFKAFNDRYGHPAGDACLVQVAQLLMRCANRATDIVARLGGEEFGVVLPEATAAGGEEVARRIVDMLAAASIPHAGSPGGIMTLSAGIASLEGPDGPGPSEMFAQADKALYEAKRNGRNSIVRFGAAPVAVRA